MDKNIIDFNKYDEFIAEQYQIEDEFFENLIKDREANFWTDYDKNFEF